MSTILGSDAPAYTVPDSIEPIIAWRRFQLTDTAGALRLASDNGTVWEPGEPLRAMCNGYSAHHMAPHESCRCGIYSATDYDTLSGIGYGDGTILAEVALWGKIIPATHGYRAEMAYPVRLYTDLPEATRLEIAITYSAECLPLPETVTDARWARQLRAQADDLRRQRVAAIERERRERLAREERARWKAMRDKLIELPRGCPLHIAQSRGFEGLQAWILQGRSDPYIGRPIGNNTRLRAVDSDSIAVHLHRTDVVTLHRDGTVKLNTGGWFTVTTAARIHEGLTLFGVPGTVRSSYDLRDGIWRFWSYHEWELPGCPERPANGRTREGRAQLAARRQWIRDNVPAFDGHTLTLKPTYGKAA